MIGSVAMMIVAILMPSGDVNAKSLNCDAPGSILISSVSNIFFSFTCSGHHFG